MDSVVFTEALQGAIVFTNFLQLAHWGTRGMFAFPYHELFGKLHDEMSATIDQLGELASIKGYAVNSEIYDAPTPKITTSNPAQLLNGALNLLDEYKDSLLRLCEAAESNKERGVINAVDDRFTQIDVMQYLLEASLPSEPKPPVVAGDEPPIAEIVGSKSESDQK
jgi:DNA-binding ferritin-like protein